MKHTAGYAKPRRLTLAEANARLNLQQRPKPEPRDEFEARQQGTFWKWVLIVALLHVVVIAVMWVVFELTPTAKPPEQFISLLPPGDVVKGTTGAQQAHKLGATTLPPAHHAPPPTPAPPKPVAQVTKPIVPPPVVTPKPPPPQPIAKTQATSLVPDKPTPKPPPKPVKPKVKVDLNLADAPASAEPAKPVKHPPKKPAKKTDDDENIADSPNVIPLSKAQIAEKLGDKLDAEGVKNALKIGPAGSTNSHASKFADFYAAIRDQVMSHWENPNLADETAIYPVVKIFVEKDGRVPPESVSLAQSSGNATYDESALAAARNLGYLHEPLPVGCPPEITINFKLTR